MAVMGETSSDHIREARSKIDLLAQDQTARRVLGHGDSFAALCRAVGINRNNLYTQTKDDWIRDDYQEALSRHLKFSRDWEEWKTGSAQEFMRRYRAVHQATVRASQRQTDLRISAGPRQKTIKSKIEGLASVEIQGHQFGLGTASIELNISCGQPQIYGKGTTIKSGRVELLCYPALLSKESHQRWMTADGKAVGNKGTVAIAFEAGTRDAPAWRLTADGASIGNIELDPDFATLEELAPGDEITVVFGTWLSDIDEAGESDSDAVSIVNTDGTALAAPQEDDLPLVKRRVIACLRKKLLPADDNGYVELARHTLRIVAAVNT